MIDKLKGFLRSILQEIMKKIDGTSDQDLVNEAIVPSIQSQRVFYVLKIVGFLSVKDVTNEN